VSRAKTRASKTAASKAGARKAPARQPPAKGTGAPSASQRIAARFASLGDWRGERLTEIRKLIHQVDPGVVEDWKWMGTAVWSHDGMYVLANPHKGKVKITFFHGAKLADPKKLKCIQLFPDLRM
jgi:hypothetical protein